MSNSQLSVEQVRAEVREFFQKSGKDDLRLVWLLGEIHGGKLYREWGFGSFRDWYKAEGGDGISLSHAYALARVGKTFLLQREEIERKFANGEITIRQLMDMASRADGGDHDANPPSTVGDSNSPGITVPRDSMEPRVCLRISIPKGDLSNVLAGLTMEALASKVPTLSDAVRARGIDNFLFGAQATSDFKEYAKYKDLILEGKFFCACCNKIPMTPTFHHMLPVSIGRGYGPRALLCWEPCHEQVVQPRWKHFCGRWGFDWKELKAEADRQLAETGVVDETPTAIITGTAIGVSS